MNLSLDGSENVLKLFAQLCDKFMLKGTMQNLLQGYR